jgi:hypothetical protein
MWTRPRRGTAAFTGTRGSRRRRPTRSRPPSSADTTRDRPRNLYDLKADPFQLNNLATEAAHVDTFKALQTQLDRWMEDQGDEGLKTERALPDPRPKKKKDKQ